MHVCMHEELYRLKKSRAPGDNLIPVIYLYIYFPLHTMAIQKLFRGYSKFPLTKFKIKIRIFLLNLYKVESNQSTAGI